MEKVGLITAMNSESEALIRRLKNPKKISISHVRGVVFQAGKRECTLVTSGMGIRQAAEGARVLIEATHPDWLISFGIAGAVREDLQIGDVVLAIQNGALENGSIKSLQPLAAFPEETWDRVKNTLRAEGVPAYLGTAITTRGSQFSLQAQELDNPILEMETAGLLQVAQTYSIPLFVLRAISDGPRAPLPLDLTRVMDEDSHLLPGKLLLELVKHPGILGKAGPMLRNSRIAAENAARAVLIALESQLSLLKA
jgi:adenosylhomocysteine nucleosidase